jgi:DNA-binding HxlR family transcriptional regulator
MCAMAGLRTYGDRCGVARSLDVVGERWALLIVRELLLGPKRFSDLRAGLPGVSPDVLTQRLRELQRAGVVRRAKLPPPNAVRVYELTDRGLELEPVVIALGRWGSAAPVPPGDPSLGVDAAVIALKTVFDPDAAQGLSATYELRLDEQPFRIRVADGDIELGRGSAERPDATIRTDPATLSSVLWHGRGLAEAKRGGDIAFDGSGQAIKRFLGLFPAPSST